VAELTIALMFALLRSIPFSDRALKQEEWSRRKGMEAGEKTLGLIGCGSIGKRVARLASAMGMKVAAFDMFPDKDFSTEGFTWMERDQVLRQADVLSLHCPPGETPLINEGTIGLMKKGVYIINTARAGLVDEKALLNALTTETVAGYATDVFEQEPPADFSLAKHEKVIATPHIGGFTLESIDRATRDAVGHILHYM
jgi:D-3-phosphoglycerate dehydrogenase